VLEELQAQVASIIQRIDSNPGLSLKKVQSLIAASASSASAGTTFTEEDPVELADEASGTLGAWTTISAGAPANAVKVRIIYHLQGGPAIGYYRQENGSPEIDFHCGTDTRYSIWFDIPLTGTGTFDYYMEAAFDNWSMNRIGYHL